MIIEIGKKYRTRGGWMAEVVGKLHRRPRKRRANRL
jgi:hypothetical protein